MILITVEVILAVVIAGGVADHLIACFLLQCEPLARKGTAGF